MISETHMTLLRDWNGKTDLRGWLASEKLDGCRAFWDGFNLWTRGGNRIAAPRWFARGLPAGVRLDGELWAGRESFALAQRATQHGDFSEAVRFHVFDAPDAAGTWADRMRVAAAAIAGSKVCRAVKFCAVRDFDHLCKIFFAIHGAMGEGLVLRNPAATGYERGRTRNALRIKHDPEWNY